jgi:hypothetical protein
MDMKRYLVTQIFEGVVVKPAVERSDSIIRRNYFSKHISAVLDKGKDATEFT